jgi:hypothetical protein
MPGDYEVIWEDETVWTFGWEPDAGCFSVDRCIPEEDDFPIDDIIDTPAPHICFVESLDALEKAMVARYLPTSVPSSKPTPTRIRSVRSDSPRGASGTATRSRARHATASGSRRSRRPAIPIRSTAAGWPRSTSTSEDCCRNPGLVR